MTYNPEAFYIALESQFRGSRELIKARQRAYEPLLGVLRQYHPDGGGPLRALDLGCGRGEWLEQLGEHGIEASGIDSNQRMVDICRDLGLNVSQGNVLDAVKELPGQSFDLISAFHLVEHLNLDDQLSLLAGIRRILKPGGVVILETPNPENILVSGHTFYLDPTHTRPIPPALLQFMSDFTGFNFREILRLHPRNDLPTPVLADGQPLLISTFFNIGQDYAVILSHGQSQPQREALAQSLAIIQAAQLAKPAESASPKVGAPFNKSRFSSSRWANKVKAILRK